MRSTLYAACILAAAEYAAAASDKPLQPCTIVSPTGKFFDLSAMQRRPIKEGDKKANGGAENSYVARGYDYGANFTVNFCGPVVEDVHSFEDLDKDLAKNVSAYYEIGGKKFAIG